MPKLVVFHLNLAGFMRSWTSLVTQFRSRCALFKLVFLPDV